MTTLPPPPTRQRRRPAAAYDRSSLDRPLPVARRRDLTAVAHRYLGVRYWIVKDPIGLKYYRFPEEEYALLQMLDGEASLRDLIERFEAEFPPRKMAPETVQKFLGRLHERGLVVVDRPGQAEVLRRREQEIQRKNTVSTLTNALSIRFPGVDPERTLTRLNRWLGWVFSPVAALGFAVLGVAALLLLATNFQALLLKLPSLPAFFATDNLIALAIAMIGCKICHEFGHGLAAKRFGGECHRMGFMLLVFMPAMYCDVSDSWLLPSKWRRIAIAAAGVYVELILASLATFGWWFTQPGLVHNLCLGVMVSSSVSTLLVNANPLLRFDGYYVLADWLETPNLATRSRQEVRDLFFCYACGFDVRHRETASPRMRAVLVAYGLASQAYRIMLVVAITTMLHEWLGPMGLGVVADGLLVMSLVTLFGVPAVAYAKVFASPGRFRSMKPLRVATTLLVTGSLAAFALLVPLPHDVRCDVLLDLRDTRLVYADPGGRLEALLVEPGDYVEAGEPIARLSNLDLELEIAHLESQRRELEATLDGVTRTQLVSSDASRDIEAYRDQIQRFDEQLTHRRKQQEQLVLRAPRAGRVAPLPNAPVSRGERTGEPPFRFDPSQLGATLRSGEWVCQIGDPADLKATLLLNQSDSGDVHAGQRVSLRLHALPMRTFETEISDMATDGQPTGFSQAGPDWDVLLSTDAAPTDGVGDGSAVAFRATARVDNSDNLLRPGMLGSAKVRVGSRTLAQMAWARVWEHLQF